MYGRSKSRLSFLLSGFFLFTLSSHVSWAESKQGVLNAEQWEASRSGHEIAQIPIVRNMINQWMTDTDQQLVLYYPSGEDGEIWVVELRDWMVALGIPSESISTAPGSGSGDVIRLVVVRTGEIYR